MKVRVLLGTVRADDKEYKVGEELELPENEARAIVREGVVEEAKEEKPKAKPKKEPKEEPKPEPEAEAKAEPEPSMDWTAKEILDYGVAKGVEDLEGRTKQEMLALIKASEEGGEEK